MGQQKPPTLQFLSLEANTVVLRKSDLIAQREKAFKKPHFD